jgi:hypothetical protein
MANAVCSISAETPGGEVKLLPDCLSAISMSSALVQREFLAQNSSGPRVLDSGSHDLAFEHHYDQQGVHDVPPDARYVDLLFRRALLSP